MSKMSILEATRHFDVSRPTLQKALKEGKITGTRVKAGGSDSWQIDAAELARFYKSREDLTDKSLHTVSRDGSGLASDLPQLYKALEDLAKAKSEVDQLKDEVSRLRAELAIETKLRAVAEALAEDRAEALKEEKASREALWGNLAKLIEDKTKPKSEPVEQEPKAKRRWFWGK